MRKPTTYQEIEARCRELLQLEENWDSYGARPISKRTVGYCLHVIRRLLDAGAPAPDHFYPMPDGGISADWENPRTDHWLSITFHWRGARVHGAWIERGAQASIAQHDDVPLGVLWRQLPTLIRRVAGEPIEA